MAKAGRKGKYEYWLSQNGLLLIEGWARDGLSKEQIAKNIGCSRDTLNEWEKRFPDISDALKKGREVVIREVENALIKRAKGYEVEEVTEELRFNRSTGKEELRVTKRSTKHIAPDTGAAAFVLKNLASKTWSDRKEVEIGGSLDAEKSKLDEMIEQMRRKA